MSVCSAWGTDSGGDCCGSSGGYCGSEWTSNDPTQWLSVGGCNGLDFIRVSAGCGVEVATGSDGGGTRYTYDSSVLVCGYEDCETRSTPGCDSVRSVRLFPLASPPPPYPPLFAPRPPPPPPPSTLQFFASPEQSYAGAVAYCASLGGMLASPNAEVQAALSSWTSREIWIRDGGSGSSSGFDTCYPGGCPCYNCANQGEEKPFVCELPSVPAGPAVVTIRAYANADLSGELGALPSTTVALPHMVSTPSGCMQLGQGFFMASCNPSTGYLSWNNYADATCVTATWSSVWSENALSYGSFPISSGNEPASSPCQVRSCLRGPLLSGAPDLAALDAASACAARRNSTRIPS